MYYAMYGDEYLYDPVDSDRQVSELKIDCGINESGSCTFVIPPTNKCYSSLAIRDLRNEIYVYNDDTVLFDGFVYSVTINMDRTMEIEAKGCLAYLADTVVRPYSSYDSVNEGVIKVSSEPAKLFEFYIEQHNKYCNEGKTFKIGANEANLLDTDLKCYRQNSDYPSTADEITTQLLESIGGYLFVKHENGTRYIDYLANCNDTNSQIIDFGVNLLDYIQESTSEDMYTAVRPLGGSVSNTTKDANGNETTTDTVIDLSTIPDETRYEQYYVKRGDRILYLPSVEKYGIIEEYYNDTDSLTPEALVKSTIKHMKSAVKPFETFEIKALDLSLLSDEYKPLVPGNLVRVRSRVHDYDSYLLVTSMEIDINNPDNTTYELGGVKNTYTGVENAKIKTLNASINDNYDTVSSLTEDVKKSSIAIDNVTNIASSKRRVFVDEPTSPYDIGDLWVKKSTDSAGNIKTIVMVCNTAKESGDNFDEADWGLASTDDTVADEAKSIAQEAKDAVPEITLEKTDNGYNIIVKQDGKTQTQTAYNGDDGKTPSITATYDSTIKKTIIKVDDAEIARISDGADGMSIKGDDGAPAYLHIAYANSSDGQVDFSITDGNGKSYIVQYTDSTKADSTTPSDYTWTIIKGLSIHDFSKFYGNSRTLSEWEELIDEELAFKTSGSTTLPDYKTNDQFTAKGVISDMDNASIEIFGIITSFTWTHSAKTTYTAYDYTVVPKITNVIYGKTGATGATGATGKTGATGATGATGEDGYTIIIESSAGNIFKNSSGSTILTARLYQGGIEIDSSGAYTYTWSKYDASGTKDTTFSATGKTLSITASDVNVKATYEVDIEW